ncbi:hypothetical protein TUM12370_18150 [Salmonella enterica subsp. enterica serovar Choleraesuis]|nr:hypothetical protein TUM12370_18150 [Salmonella enterica subsp. enterica serovar Choleraesuis]
MAKNDFKAFAIGANANVLSQADYEALEAVGTGFQSGVALSEQLNKVWRQGSTMAAVLANFIASKAGDDVLDDGNLNKLQSSLVKALLNNSTAQLDGRYLNIAKNLSDLSDPTKARQSLGLKGAAVLDVGTTAGTVAAGNDSRIVNALQKGNNLSDLTSAATARTNLGLGTAATASVQTSADDVTAGRVLVNGNAIACRTIRYNAGSNFNDAPANSTSFVYGTATNSPGITGSVLDFSGFNNRYNVQIAADYGSAANRMKFRTKNGDSNAWNNWYEIYHTGNKPSAQDVDAVSATNGGTFSGNVAFERAILVSANYPGILLRDADMADGVGKRILLEQNNGSLYIASRRDDGSLTGQTTLIFPQVSGTIYSTGNKPTASDVGALATTGGTLSGQLNTPDTGHGAYAGQYTSGAPLMQTVTAAETSSTFWPMIKQKITTTGANPYAYAVSTGALTSVSQLIAWQAHIRSYGGADYVMSFSAQNGGRLTVPEQMIPGNYGNFDARYQARGNYTPAGEAYTKSESDNRFQPKGNYTPAGQAYTKAESDNRFQLKNTASKAANLWHKDTSTGVITQSGFIRANDNEVTTANFPIPFPSACSSLQVTACSSAGNSANLILSAYGQAISNTQMKVSVCANWDQHGATGVYFEATGY